MAAIPPQLIGESPEFHALLNWVSDIASLNLPVLVLGEAGTGKEMIASRLHFLSPRWEQSYHAINCAAYDPAILSDIIFGEGLNTALLETAEGGTLFFDNIESLPASVLERLARLVEYNVYRPNDGQDDQAVDIRFVFSADPAILARSARRAEISAFLDRLATDVVNIPPLRDRKTDIVPLLLHFGRKSASKLGADQFPGVTSEAMEALLGYDWPGNVRELKSVIERSTARAFLTDETLSAPIANIFFSPFMTAFREKPRNAERISPISSPALPKTANAYVSSAPMGKPPLTKEFGDRVYAFERGLIDEAMTTQDHHQGKAAEYLGLSYHQFRGLLRKHGLRK